MRVSQQLADITEMGEISSYEIYLENNANWDLKTKTTPHTPSHTPLPPTVIYSKNCLLLSIFQAAPCISARIPNKIL